MVNVTISSAIELTSTQLETVKKAVSKKYGKDVQYFTEVNPSLLGGIQLRVGSRLFDGSIKNKVDQLKANLIQK